MERGHDVNMDERNKCKKIPGPPCGTMDGGNIWLIMQYGWIGWIVNMPIHTMGVSCDGTQIEVNFEKWPRKS